MNIIRGSGIAGLKGIEAKRDNLIRPLIECSRDEIEEYCKTNNLNPKIDKTNFENIYTRNKVRNMLIPYIKENFNPNIIEGLKRLSDLSKQENEYLEKTTARVYKDILMEEQKNQIILDLNKFNLQELVIKSRLVLYTINILFGTRSGIEKKHIEDIIKLCSNNIGNKFLIPNKKVKILVKNKKIFFIANQ
jgi:tRNA(Ile)-lysidine synthase